MTKIYVPMKVDFRTQKTYGGDMTANSYVVFATRAEAEKWITEHDLHVTGVVWTVIETTWDNIDV